jgi:hypothetical protein
MNFGPPLALVSTISLPAAGTPVLFSSDKLQAPNREALAISEIRFYSGYVNNEARMAAREIRISISVGSRWRICESIPLWTICPIRAIPMAVMGSGYRIKLRKPLFIPPGMAIIASARRIPDPSGSVYPAAAIPLSMTLVARTVVSRFPRIANVPYLSAYCPNGALSGLFSSLEEDLKNDSDQPLEIQHLVGKLGYGVDDGAGGIYVRDADHLAAIAPMRLSYQGSEIIPEGTDFNAAFDLPTRSLPMAGMVLDKGKRLMFSMPTPSWAAGTFNGWMPTLGFLANRQEVVP